jgi:hypothetical protein
LKFSFYFSKIKKFARPCRVVDFAAVFTEKYQYGENRVANQNFKNRFKSPDIGPKNAQNNFQKNPQICFLGKIL